LHIALIECGCAATKRFFGGATRVKGKNRRYADGD
jgi:hypothetical protein